MVTMLTTILMTAGSILAALPCWEFDSAAEKPVWVPNSHLSDVRIHEGRMQATATGLDPFFSCHGLSIKATPWQCVMIRIKSNETGTCELFWSGATTGRYGGLSPRKKTAFALQGDNRWHDIVLLPFWQGEGLIKQLRLDLFFGATISIDSIKIESWAGANSEPQTQTAWSFDNDASSWKTFNDATDFFSPPLKVNVDSVRWVCVQVESATAGVGWIVWASQGRGHTHSREFVVELGLGNRVYNIDMKDVAGWAGEINLLGIHVPASTRLNKVTLSPRPLGDARPEVLSVGLSEGVIRTGRTAKLTCLIHNVGGKTLSGFAVAVKLPPGIICVGTGEQKLPALRPGDRGECHWTVKADHAGRYVAEVRAVGSGKLLAKCRIHIAPHVDAARADYVPPPKPVATDLDVCAFYFPGFDSDKKWDPIRTTSPIRKPLLGWYNEGSSECVDWQIKWARENGISVFLVDWYWRKGNQHLTHWFEAYRKARYRDQLKVAIMWANHNPPDSHSLEDWDKVTREWITRYFSLPGYYRIDGKPAVFLWDPRRLREDLVQAAMRDKVDGKAVPSSEELVRKALEHSQQLARDAGYPGIHFVAMMFGISPATNKLLAREGYNAITTYHEWGRAREMSTSPKRASYEDVVTTAPERWQRWLKAAEPLEYYPLVDTGWDARPWHGERSLVIGERTPERFGRLLRQAKSFAEKNNIPRVVLGPVNEWGEGSYIEPCAEFGFEMMEDIRAAFGKGDPKAWPVNIGPADVGLGPYDYPKPRQKDASNSKEK